jgi:hypothetical protein
MNVSPAVLLALARAMGDLATENVEASWAFRFAVHFFDAEEMRTESLVARVMAWMAEKRTAANNDPRIVPRTLAPSSATLRDGAPPRRRSSTRRPRSETAPTNVVLPAPNPPPTPARCRGSAGSRYSRHHGSAEWSV